MTRQGSLGEFEQLLLLALLSLGDEATGTAVTEKLESDANRRVSRGALYSALDRLEAKGFLTWELRESSAARGGHASRVFTVTEAGIASLAQQQQILRSLTRGLESILGLTDV